VDQALMQKLAEPFEPDEVKWKAQVARGNRALAVAYVDARVVEDRLDDVFGVEGWQDSYRVLPNNSVVCTLKVKVGDQWITKEDVGSQSEQPDEGDRMKSAFSDALKRAAVKLGIGRYLYRLPQQWVDYDANTRQLKSKPRLPDFAMPKHAPAAPKPAQNGQAEAPRATKEQLRQLQDAIADSGADYDAMKLHYGGHPAKEWPAHKVVEALSFIEQKFSPFFPAAVGDAHEG
jgi:hypothetical protein